MEKEKKIRTHKLLDSHPYLGTLLLLAVEYIVANAVILVLVVLGTIIPGLKSADSISSIVGYLLAYLVFLWWFRPELKNVIRKFDVKKFLVYLGLFAGYWGITYAAGFALGNSYAFPALSAVLISLAAGVSEEIIFRGLIITPLLRNNVNSKGVKMALIISSLVFGLIHAANLFAGASPSATLYQVIVATFLGCVMGTVYIFTGSLIPSMILHTVHDIIAFSNVGAVSSEGVMDQDVAPSDFGFLIVVIIFAVIVLKVSLKKGWEEQLKETWSEIWLKTQD